MNNLTQERLILEYNFPLRFSQLQRKGNLAKRLPEKMRAWGGFTYQEWVVRLGRELSVKCLSSGIKPWVWSLYPIKAGHACYPSTRQVKVRGAEIQTILAYTMVWGQPELHEMLTLERCFGDRYQSHLTNRSHKLNDLIKTTEQANGNASGILKQVFWKHILHAIIIHTVTINPQKHPMSRLTLTSETRK